MMQETSYLVLRLKLIDSSFADLLFAKSRTSVVFPVPLGPIINTKRPASWALFKISKDLFQSSLRTRESHLIGTKTLTEGSVGFDEGLLVKSMREGNMLYLDELNSAEADVLLRLDEALDDRRQIVLKESTGETVRAHENWFVVATINPLTHVGTKELPPQLLSRFPVRIRLEYPPEEIELEIIKKHVSDAKDDEIIQGIKLANTLRQAASVEELDYSPSLRETISYAKLLSQGTQSKEAANIVFGNVYAQWGNVEYQKVSDIITSMFGN